MIIIVIIILGIVLLYLLHRARSVSFDLESLSKKIATLACTEEVFEIVKQENISLEDIKKLIRQSQSDVRKEIETAKES